MTERGRITEIGEESVTIAANKSAACFGCLNMECKTNGGFITAGNPSSLPLKTGQTVEVKAPARAILLQALAALLPPILGFSAGYALAPLLFPNARGAAAAMGLFFLFTPAFIIYKIRKKYPASKEFSVTRIIA